MTEIEKVKNTIKSEFSELDEVSTKSKQSGIYCFYIDGIDSNTIIPLYIGQSKNIYSRINRHKSEIRKLLKLSGDIYNRFLLVSTKYLYFKTCSIIINNNLNFFDLKFKILEYCSEKELDKKEQYYIKLYKTTKYGFNQFNEIIESRKTTNSIYYGAMGKIEERKQLENIFQKYNKKILHCNMKSMEKYPFYRLNYSLLIGDYRSIKLNFSKMLNTKKINTVIKELDKIIDQFDIEPTKLLLNDLLRIPESYILTYNLKK